MGTEQVGGFRGLLPIPPLCPCVCGYHGLDLTTPANAVDLAAMDASMWYLDASTLRNVC